jgi:hypothetical protein
VIWLGLFLALASVPGYTSAAIPAGWAALSLTLPIAAWRPGVPTWAHAAMGLFLFYVFASISWSLEPLDGLYRLWQFSLIGGAFWLGTVREPRPIIIGLTLGYILSTCLAFGQYLGYDFVLRHDPNTYPGLHFLGAFSGAIGALLLVALASERLWLLAATCLPGIYLSDSRGAIFAALIGIAAVWIRRPILIALAAAIAISYVLLHTLQSDVERRLIWQASAVLLRPFGWGSGSYVDLFVQSTRMVQAEHAHNDFLQLLFEFGIGAFPFLAIWMGLILQSRARHWPVIASFTCLSIFFFPLYTPLCAVVFALCAGASVRDWRSTSDLLSSLRRIRLPWRSGKVVPASLPIQEGLT